MDINYPSARSQARSSKSEPEDSALSRQLCTLLNAESARTGRPWIQFSHLAELYRLQHGKALGQQFQQAGYPDALLFWRNHRQVFSTYATPEPGNPYVAVFEVVNPTQDFRWSDRPRARRHRRRPSTQLTRKL